MFLCGCREEYIRIAGVKHGITYEILCPYHFYNSNTLEIKECIAQSFNDIDHIFNHWNPNSELSLVNCAPVGEVLLLSPLLYKMLVQCSYIYKTTDGYFDPTLGIKWHEKTGKTKINHSIGFKFLDISRENQVIKRKNVYINLDGIVKGHLVDLLSLKLSEMGAPATLISWGGEVKATSTTQKKFKVGIAPSLTTKISLNNKACATSGDYYQQIVYNNKMITHIIDKVGNPISINKLESTNITVLSQHCMHADALATAIYAYSAQSDISEYITSLKLTYPDIEVWIKTE